MCQWLGLWPLGSAPCSISFLTSNRHVNITMSKMPFLILVFPTFSSFNLLHLDKYQHDSLNYFFLVLYYQPTFKLCQLKLQYTPYLITFHHLFSNPTGVQAFIISHLDCWNSLSTDLVFAPHHCLLQTVILPSVARVIVMAEWIVTPKIHMLKL